MAEGFSASGKDIDKLISKFNAFTKALDTAGKGRQNKIFREIRRQVEALQKSYKDLKTETDSTKTYTTKVSKSTTNKKSRRSKQSSITDEEIENDLKRNARERQNKELQGSPNRLGSTPPKDIKSQSGVDAGRTTDHEMRLSEYSAHGSNWAAELARTLKEEIAKSAKTLVTYIDPVYAKNTKSGESTTEKEFLTDIIKNVRKQLQKNVSQLEAGNEDITLDTLKEQAAVIKVLSKDLGKTTEEIEKSIVSATQSIYSSNEKKLLGGTSLEAGQEKGVGPGHENTTKILSQLYTALKEWDSEVFAEKIAKEMLLGNEKLLKKTSKRNKQPSSSATEKIQEVTMSDIYQAELNKLNTVSDNTLSAIRDNNDSLGKLRDNTKLANIQSVRESSRETSADNAEARTNKESLATNRNIEETIKSDAATGFNTDANANELISTITEEGLGKAVGDIGTGSYASILATITNLLKTISDNVSLLTTNGLILRKDSKSKKTTTDSGKKKNNLPVPAGELVDQTDYSKTRILLPSQQQWDESYKRNENRFNDPDTVKKIEEELAQLNKGTHTSQQKGFVSQLEPTEIISKNVDSIFDKLKSALGQVGATSEAARIMRMTEAEQTKLRAERISKYGLNQGRDLTDTGDIAGVRRTKSLFGWNYKSDSTNKELFQDIRLTPGLGTINTNEILADLQKAIQDNMFSAQTGGGTLRNVLGSMTGYIGMPSLEKSRAEAEGLNQVMANVRGEVTKLLQSIKTKEITLTGLQNRGDLSFDQEGRATGTSAAVKEFTDYEEQKSVLKGALAEVKMIDAVVQSCGGNVHQIIKELGFVMPELMQNNTILQNINAGLDKSGKALKFQTRTGEILNYSFQLMARSIGQMIKNWIAMLNPLSLIKKAFSDFASYDTKWQRTMNVIKYNIRRIIKPFMEWLAQQIVNIIGLVNALIKGIGSAFGKNWDLFDKDAANAEKINEELQEAANVTAGFDELHDIGSSSSAADDLSGDIYTPQWEGLNNILESIGEKIGKLAEWFSSFSAWDWLVLAGAALVGFLALKWLINLFKSGNPLQSVANGFSFLEKAVGWALLIWAFTAFTEALTDFIECMKTASWEDIAKSLIMLGGAFALLIAGVAGIETVTKLVGTSASELFGLSALVGVFSLFVDAIIPFIELMANIYKEFPDEGDQFTILAGSLSMLAFAFIELIAGVAGMEKLTKLIGLDWSSLLGLAAVVGVFDLFVAALVPFIECIQSIPEGEKIETIIGTFGALVTAFLALAAGVGAVSKTFTTMDWSAIGQLYVVAGVFELFMGVLVLFVNAIKDVSFETLAGGAILIAAAFLSLGGAIALLAPALKMLDWSSILQGVVLMAALAGVIYVLSEFVQSLQGLTSEQLISGLALLAGGLLAITVAISALAIVFTAVATTGIGLAAIALLAVVLAAVMGIIYAFAELVRALGESGEGIKLILEGVSEVITSMAEGLANIFQTIGEVIVNVVTAIANGITTVLEPILSFVDSVMGKIVELASTVAHEIGETIRTVVETVGKVIVSIINSIVNAIPTLLSSILNFVNNIGPAIENSADAIMRTITKLINFMVSGIEYLVNNLVIGSINAAISSITFGVYSHAFDTISIPRFVPQYEQGTNYVPNDGLAYLHQGEAVVPKKYNHPTETGMSNEERAYMTQLMNTIMTLDSTVKQGISVNGQFVQKGSDLVATVEKVSNKQSNKILSNRVFAR